MNSEHLVKHFKAMGARIKFRPMPVPRWVRPGANPQRLTLDIARDKVGEYFDVALGDEPPRLDLLQVKAKERHLLLLSSEGERYLCGHDERHWFVAAVGKPVSTVRDAKSALMPDGVWNEVKRWSPRDFDNRKNAAFVRQGEWFFVPADRHPPKNAVILKNEPLKRGGGSKPHVCDELYREGGFQVWIVKGQHLTEGEYRNRIKSDPKFARLPVNKMAANPTVYVRGAVRHADHETIRLEGWHRVFINAEPTTSSVTFLD